MNFSGPGMPKRNPGLELAKAFGVKSTPPVARTAAQLFNSQLQMTALIGDHSALPNEYDNVAVPC